MKGTVSKTKIDALQPGETLWDDRVRGFYVQAGTRFKSYGVFRWFDGRKKRWTIAKVGDVTPDQARREAQRIVAQIALGQDPFPQSDKSMLVAALCELFLEQHLPKLKPNSQDDYRRQIERRIMPSLGKLEVAKVTHSDIAKLHSKMSKTPVIANHVRRVIHKLFEFAKDHELYTGDNPARRVRQYKENARTRYLSQTEIRRLITVLDNYKHRPVADCLKLLLLTGARKNEIALVKWEHVNLEAGVLDLPDSKTGSKTIILSPDAQTILKALWRPKSSGYIFKSAEGNSVTHSLYWHWNRIRREAGIVDVPIHSLRHSYASLLASQGVSLAIVGKLLGHRDLKSTARYSHLYDSALREAAAAAGAAINGGK